MAAEQARAAAKLEHVGALKFGKKPCQSAGDRALEPCVTLIALRARTELGGDLGATPGENWRIQGHGARTIPGASRVGHGRRPATRRASPSAISPRSSQKVQWHRRGRRGQAWRIEVRL